MLFLSRLLLGECAVLLFRVLLVGLLKLGRG